MKPNSLAIYFCVAFLPSIIHGKKLLEYARDVEKMAAGEGLINGVFKPLPGGFKGNGSFGFVHVGFMLPNDKNIAMKFTLPSQESLAEREYRIFSYLNAINCTESEKYGIPTVYYYGRWNNTDLILMGFSLLEKSIESLAKSKQLFDHDVNILIILRDFVLTSKYMHSHACRHDDIHLGNLMIRGFKTFIIDLNISSEMRRSTMACTPEYASRRYHECVPRYAVDDWESFLYSICEVIPGVKFDWMKKKSAKMLKYKANTDKTIRRIGKIKSPTLRRIFVTLAQHIFNDCANKEFPEYDVIYNWINSEIESFDLPNPKMFTWLKNEARDAAIADFYSYPTPNISDLVVPTNYEAITYTEPDFDFFVREYASWEK